MAIITISRQNGSLGDEIADALAARLGTTVVSRKYALENFFGEINQGTLDRLNESAKFFDLTLPGSDRTYADILVERIRALASDKLLTILICDPENKVADIRLFAVRELSCIFIETPRERLQREFVHNRFCHFLCDIFFTPNIVI